MLKRFVAYYKPHKARFALDLFCAFIVSGVDLCYPLMTQYGLRTLLPGGEYRRFFVLVVAAAFLYVLRAFMMFLVTYLGHELGVRMEGDMRRDLFTHLTELPFRFYDKTRTGVLLSRVTNDLFEITELAHHGPEDLFISVVTILGSFIVMFSIEWRLALVLALAMPFMLFFTVRTRKRMRETSRAVKERTADINAGIESSISGARVAKAFTNEKFEIEKFEEGNARFIKSKKAYYRVMGLFMSGVDFFIGMFNVLVLGVGGLLIFRQKLDPLVLITFTLYVSSFVQPVRRLSHFTETFTMGMAGFTRFCELMDVRPDIEDRADALPLTHVKGEIEFQDVSFAYDEGVNVLKGVSFTVPAGKTLALVGPSGGGKTTLCHLIPRFYETTGGTIFIDQKDIRSVTLKSLRANIGIVQQDVFLFAGSIRDNIRYGRTDATEPEVVAAAMAAEIHEDIMALPNGYDTQVGERGVMLSGGQKQRISIARIFLKNPPILILDEATSALDNATEARIQAAFERLSQGRTTMVIAHRLSTIRNADEIIVIDETGIREQGTHQELLMMKGEYYKLSRVLEERE